ncbi:MAG: Nitronate monooxygenase [Dehalococcoidia bacterium]|nr:Nitronate monooxygenase [Chloroflexota bacterium]
MKTILCDLLGIEYPVIQGGMAWLGTWELSSAVSRAGGLGLIGAGNAPPEWVREQICCIREQTEKPFGVNIMLMSPFLEEVITVILDENVPIVSTGGGNPGAYIRRFKEAGMKVIPVVSSVALARRLERSGADALVAEGSESGGHIGDTTTMALVPQIVDCVSIPVIAAGGIGDGRGMAAALALGAQGIQMGTRFICSTECIAHPQFKEAILKAQDRATVVTGESTGHPVRVIKNRLARQFLAMEKNGVSREDLERFGEGKLQLGVIQGDIDNGSLMCGQIAGLIGSIKPVRTIIDDMVAEAEAIVKRLARLANSNPEATDA